eukprot:COSAG05_NODE_1382_length_5019_cov_58.408740_2_plen_56_part_00
MQAQSWTPPMASWRKQQQHTPVPSPLDTVNDCYLPYILRLFLNVILFVLVSRRSR